MVTCAKLAPKSQSSNSAVQQANAWTLMFQLHRK